MGKSDHELGMDRDITGRDFLNGVCVAVGGSLVLLVTDVFRPQFLYPYSEKLGRNPSLDCVDFWSVGHAAQTSMKGDTIDRARRPLEHVDMREGSVR